MWSIGASDLEVKETCEMEFDHKLQENIETFD